MFQCWNDLNVESPQNCSELTIVANPFIPFNRKFSAKYWNLNTLIGSKAGSDTLLADWMVMHFGIAGLLFEKIEDDVIAKQLQNFQIKRKPLSWEQPCQTIEAWNYHWWFWKIDIRESALYWRPNEWRNPKLLSCVTIDTELIHEQVRAELHYSPEQVIGKK